MTSFGYNPQYDNEFDREDYNDNLLTEYNDFDFRPKTRENNRKSELYEDKFKF